MKPCERGHIGSRHCVKNLVLLPTVAHAEKTKRYQRAVARPRWRSRLLRNWRVV